MSTQQTKQSNAGPAALTGIMSPSVAGKTDLLAQEPPAITLGDAAQIAQDLFGISGDLQPLSAEKDANFLINQAEGGQRLLKISNAAEDRAVTHMQTAALMHLAQTDPSLAVPKVYASLEGHESEVVSAEDGKDHIVRLMSFLPGTVLSSATAGAGLHFELGTFLARVTRGLRGFFHPAAGHVLQWDIKQAAGLRPMLSAVADDELRKRLGVTLDRFDAEISERLPAFRAQVVHNDFNPHNVLVDGPDASRPVGLIDFGDIVHTPIICDLAVACSYQISDGAAPLEQICQMIAGYARLLPLEREEIDLLPDLIRLRHATTLIVGASRAQRYPENAEYILRNARTSLRGLDTLDRIGGDATRKALHVAVRTEVSR